MAKRTYEFDILAKIDQAVASVNKFADQSQKQLDRISFNTTVSAVSDGFRLLEDVGSKAFGAIESVMRKAIDAASAQEEADVRLANALRLMGDGSKSAIANFDRLAASISSTTRYSDASVKSSFALAKQFQLTNAEAERAVKVAVDLAAAQGISLDEATRKVSQTFQGFVDRDLARMIPGLKNLGLQSLVSGNALGLIAKRVDGTAQALGNTFTGAITRAGEKFDHLLETLGDLVIKNPAIIAGINVIGRGFEQMNLSLKKNGDSVRNIVTDGFILLIEAAPALLQVIGRIASDLDKIYLGAQKAALVIAQGPTAVLQAVTGTTDYLDDLIDRLDKLDEAFGKRENARQDFFEPLVAQVKELANRTVKAVNAARDVAPAYQAAVNGIGTSVSGVAARVEGLADQFKAQLESISKDPVVVGFDLFIRKKIDFNKNDAIALGLGLVAQVVKGAEGAKKVLSDAIGGVFDTLLPGIGGVVSQIVGVLGEGPEKTKEMVDGFINEIPTFIENLAQSLPVLITEIAEKLPPALAKAAPIVMIGFTTELLKHIPEIVKGFAEGLITGAKDFIQSLINAITGGIFGGGGGLFGGGHGGGGIISGSGIPVISTIGDILGLADGGRVPDVPQLGGDRALVRLSRNEQVLSGDLSDDLQSYLKEQRAGGQTVHVTAQLVMDKRVLAEQMFKIRKAGFRT